MQNVRITLRHDPNAPLDFGPFLTDAEALNFIKVAKENKHVRTAYRSDVLSPDTFIDYLPTE